MSNVVVIDTCKKGFTLQSHIANSHGETDLMVTFELQSHVADTCEGLQNCDTVHKGPHWF